MNRLSPALTPLDPERRDAHTERRNWIGLWTLYSREVRRFAKVYNQTILAPVITTLIFLAIFGVAFHREAEMVAGVPILQFLAPGLTMMAVVQNAFANTSSSIIIQKVQGNIVDTLMPPLSPGELTAGFAFGGVTRGLAVGVVVAAAIAVFVPVGLHNLAGLIFFPAAGALMLSLIGIAGGVWAEKFDQIAAVTNFIIIPLSFLSGTFYSTSRLPAPFALLSHIDPFFYVIDGYRWAVLGRSDMNPLIGAVLLVVLNALLWALCHWMFRTGYRIKP